MQRLLFISNLFPDSSQPWRGLDNVTLLHAMREQRPEVDIRALCLRPSHRFWSRTPAELQPRPQDAQFQPHFIWAPYLPKLGGINDRLFTIALHRALRRLPSAWQPDALLVPWLFPDASGVHRCAALRHLPMLAVAQGLDLLIQSCAKAQKQLPQPLHLVMIGSGPLENELRVQAARESLNIIFAGRKSPFEVAQFMRAADVVCLSSHNEGVPNVLLEAFASGRAFVSTDVGGIHEIVSGSPYGGLLCRRDPQAYAQCLSQVLTKAPDSAEIQAYASRYSWQQCSSKYWESLDSLCMCRI